VQCASPEEILSAAKDAFIADFVGTDRALKRARQCKRQLVSIPSSPQRATRHGLA
jgi:ABC-type proline/glycine betaine transport system ATPase subunit